MQYFFECKIEDFQNCENHGKCRDDGATHVLQSSGKRIFNDQYGEVLRNIVRHLAGNFPLLFQAR